MDYLVLARKWRPKTFSEVIGQDHIIKSISYALKAQHVSHAYLFAGTRGVGKTSIARLLAKSLTCQRPIGIDPCHECSSCESIDHDNSLDVVEIDGASHNGVDHIRGIIETVNFLPAFGKYKVYIIDEVHMLSREAFNALLKTLESPPSYVVFIFATTVPEKILDTVLSRCLRYDFRPLPEKVLEKHLSYILKEESIRIKGDQIVRLIAHEAKGSVRDALTLLEQALTYSDEERFLDDSSIESLGLVKKSLLENIVISMIDGNFSLLKSSFVEVTSHISNLSSFGDALLDEIYHLIQFKLEKKQSLIYDNQLKTLSSAELFWIYESLAKDLSWAFSTTMPHLTVELILQKICLRDSFFLNSKSENKKETEKEQEKAPIPKLEILSWKSFLKYLKGEHKALSVNLEHANLIGISTDVSLLNESKISLGFNKNGQVFYEYLSTKESKNLLCSILGKFLSKNEGQAKSLEIEFILLDEDDRKELNFKTLSEIEEESVLKKRTEREKEILDAPHLKKIVDFFDAEIVDVKVKDE